MGSFPGRPGELLGRYAGPGRFAGGPVIRIRDRLAVLSVGQPLTEGAAGREQVTGDGLRAYRYRMGAGDVQEGPFYPLPRANTRIGDVSRAGPQALVYSDKTGRVVRVQADGGSAVLYETHDASHEGAVRVVPWEVGTDAEGRIYGFMFMNGRIGVLHPYDWLDTGRVYDRALAGEVATEVSTDIAGDWIFGVGPLRDD